MEKINIVICTKDRETNFDTYNLLKPLLKHINLILILEPNQKEKYKDFQATKVEVDKPNLGIGYARYYALELLKDKYNYIWMLDDDINQILIRDYYYVEKKYWKYKSATIQDILNLLHCSIDISLKKDWVALGLPYRQLGWTFVREFEELVHISVMTLLNLKKLNGLNYKPYMRRFEDVLLMAECCNSGLKIGNWCKYAFSVAGMTKNKGGLFREYKSDNGLSYCHLFGNIIPKKYWSIRNVEKHNFIYEPTNIKYKKIYYENKN